MKSSADGGSEAKERAARSASCGEGARGNCG